MPENPPFGYDPAAHHRRSVHLRQYDYRTAGAYFVTLCTADRSLLFGEVADDQVRLTTCGHLVGACWVWLAEQYSYLKLDAWTLMPNHLHGVLVISEVPAVAGAVRRYSTLRQQGGPPTITKSLGRLIGAFKTVSTKRVNVLRGTPGEVVWQRDYYEHVVRGERELDRIRQYIADNPRRWAMDRENPSRVRRWGQRLADLALARSTVGEARC